MYPFRMCSRCRFHKGVNKDYDRSTIMQRFPLYLTRENGYNVNADQKSGGLRSVVCHCRHRRSNCHSRRDRDASALEGLHWVNFESQRHLDGRRKASHPRLDLARCRFTRSWRRGDGQTLVTMNFFPIQEIIDELVAKAPKRLSRRLRYFDQKPESD